MAYLIDTNIWIEVERGALAAADIHAVTGEEPVFISPVTIAEMYYGIELLADPALKNKCLAAMRRLRRKPMLRITGETGEVFGGLAAQLERSGRGAEFRVQDLWLAAQAVQHGCKLLTRNQKDFRDIPGLDLVIMKPRRQPSLE
jgi:predicted nucleic acid-binding protein